MYTPASLYARTQCTQLNQPPLSEVMLENIGVDSTALGRKGRLYLLCDPDSNLGMPLAFAQAYYDSPVFDILPALEASYVDAFCAADEYGDGRILAALVLQGLDIYVLAATDADVYLLREGTVSHPLRELHTRTESLDELPEDQCEIRLVRARAMMGEQIVMASRGLTDKLLSRDDRSARLRGGNNSLARRIAQLSSVDGREGPVTVISLPAITPTAGVEQSDHTPVPTRAPQDIKQSGGRRRSPVTPVIVIALLIIAIVLLVKRPSVSEDRWQQIVDWMLTPAATETPIGEGTPTSEPTPTIDYVTPAALD